MKNCQKFLTNFDKFWQQLMKLDKIWWMISFDIIWYHRFLSKNNKICQNLWKIIKFCPFYIIWYPFLSRFVKWYLLISFDIKWWPVTVTFPRLYICWHGLASILRKIVIGHLQDIMTTRFVVKLWRKQLGKIIWLITLPEYGIVFQLKP